MFSRDFKAWAREALMHRWGTAIAVALLGSLLVTGIDLMTPFTGSLTVNLENMEVGFGSVEGGLLDSIPRQTMALFMTITIVSALAVLVLGGAANMGMSTYFTNLMTRREARFQDLFCHFNRLWTGFKMQFITGLFVALWSLLLVIPGIIAMYSYAMVPYLMAEFPELRVMDAIKESKRLMRGNKMRLFFLHLSFIGWSLLSVMTMGVVGLWVSPYLRATEAGFYLDVTGRSGAYRQQPQERPMMNGPEF